MSPFEIGLLGLCGLLTLLVLRVPIAFALSIAGLAGIIALQGWDIGIFSLGDFPFAFLKSWLLVAIPLFILMGYLASTADVTADAFAVAYRWLGQLPGGLAMGTVAACAAFAATSGSSVATAGMMGAVAIPEMEKYGYSKKLASGAVAAGGLLGILIPPSIVLVMYGFITKTSVAKLLIAGIIPGILTTLIYFIGIYFMVKINPSIAPRALSFTWKERLSVVPKLWGTAVLFLAVVVGIYVGIFTPTEAAAVGAFMALLMSLYKNFRRPGTISRAFIDSGSTTGMLLAICVGATLFTQFITLTGMPEAVAEAVTKFEVAPIWVLITMLMVYLPLGLFLDTISMLLITLPIFFPIVTRFSIDPIVFGILVVKMEEISLITPPVGLNVYVIKGVAPDIPLADIFLGILPFLLMEFIVMAILIAFPQIILFLPNSMNAY
ncbi:MAG: TRAP transporter large permease [Deltaproteobacteria bacterium]|nr:TRAP transporter large permease [Deltaproteobacteria bacterium]MBW1931173.1 TRAP transporter large permease [Deltaproteobacteria bacterium]MBW2025913.1 TRAP transporter large permease [Deltaproteobacteria bacterium]MBW2125914.1 TRAP transporter large permease [Deltaproteobacteria bacterium]